MKNRDLLTIKQFAQICRTTPRTIRFYEQKGLLYPSKVDEWTKYRYYTPEQARDFFKIKLIQHFQIPLKTIHKAVKGRKLEQFLNKELENVENEIEEKKKELIFLTHIKEFLFGKNQVKGMLAYESFGPYVMFCETIKNARYDRINFYVSELLHIANKYGVECPGEHMVFYLEPNQYSPRNTKIEICLICKEKEIPKNVHITEKYFFKLFPRRQVLSYTYHGPYEYLTFIHQRMVEEVSGDTLSGYPFDFYIAGPWNKCSQYDYLTKVGYPIK